MRCIFVEQSTGGARATGVRGREGERQSVEIFERDAEKGEGVARRGSEERRRGEKRCQERENEQQSDRERVNGEREREKVKERERANGEMEIAHDERSPLLFGRSHSSAILFGRGQSSAICARQRHLTGEEDVATTDVEPLVVFAEVRNL